MKLDDLFWSHRIWNNLYRFLLCIPFANIMVYYIFLIRVFLLYGKLPELVLDRFPTLEEFSMWLFVATIFTFFPNVVLLLFLVRETVYRR